jgi:hypothetical protein
MGTVKEFTGVARDGRGGWWAYCDQLPVASYGADYNEAVQRMITSVRQYHAALRGAKPPPPRRLPRDEQVTAFRITVQLD